MNASRKSHGTIRSLMFLFLLVIIQVASVSVVCAQDPLIYFTDNVVQPPVEPTDMEVELEAYILNATSTIDAAIYGFDRSSIKAALLAAHNTNGVIVRIVTDNDAYTSYKSHYDDLRSAGILVRWDKLGSIMHNKFFIIDGHLVWTGSTNITDNGFTSNHNNSIVFDSTTMAAIYQEEFDQMLGASPRYVGAFGTEKLAQTTTSMTYNGIPLDIYFSPKNGAMDELLAEVSAATSSIYFSIFYMTDNTLRDILIAKRQNNPTMIIRGIMDAGGAENYYADDEALCEAGIQIKIEDFSGKMHHKFMVLDAGTNAARTITGSMNWTGAGGDANDENTLIIRDGLVADRPVSSAYKLEFDYLYGSLSPDTLCVESPPDTLLELHLTKVGSGLQIRTGWIGESAAYHLYGVTGEATIDLGSWEVKVEDFEFNPFGTWDTDGYSYVQFTLTDLTQLPDGNYVMVAENIEGEGPYGFKSDDSERTPDADGTAPICIGCSEPAVYGDVLINEILADPAADLAGDANGDLIRDEWDDEFVEIVNIGDRRISLAGAVLTDNVKIKHTFPRGSYLDPCQSLVVFGGGTPNETPGYFGNAVVQVSTSLLLLNNTGDTVTLVNGIDVLDQVTYGSIGGNDTSLVRYPEATRYAPFFKSTDFGTALYTPGFGIDGTTTCILGQCAVNSVSIGTVTPGETISLSTEIGLTADGYGEEPLYYEWDMNYKGGEFTPDLSGKTVAYTFPRAGIYTVAVRMTDSCMDPEFQQSIDTVQVIVNSEVATCTDITINEIDADTLGADTQEFVELHNNSGYAVNMATDGYVLVFYDGGTDTVYRRLSLDGMIGDDNFYLVGNSGVVPTPHQTFPDGGMQNGAEAVAVFKSAAGSTCTTALFDTFNTVSSPPIECVLVDAIVHCSGEADDTGLLTGLGQLVQISEGSTVAVIEANSIQRPTESQGCPGGWSTNYVTAPPTPGTACAKPSASITMVNPALSACLGTEMSFSGSGTGDGTLSYAWDFDYNGSDFIVDATGDLAVHTYLTAGTYLVALRVTDSCNRPEPQEVYNTVLISIVDCVGACADITINEVDSDTSGTTDILEFIELNNATGGAVDLASNGYVLVFFNGSNDASYVAIDLTGTITTSDPYFVIGNAGVSPDLVFANNLLQNGADAVALYRGAGCSAAEFPTNTLAALTVGDCQLVDALCYDTDDADDVTLMAALGQTVQYNEDPDTSHPSETNSIQRITDSQGCPMGWAGNGKVDAPTPGLANGSCGVVSASIVSILPSTEVCRNTQQTFNGSGSGQGTLTFEWDFDYSGVFSADATGQMVAYAYSTPGGRTVALRVTDSCINPGPQSTITTTTVNILDCCPSPTATITSVSPNRQVTVNTPMTFDGVGTGEGTLTYEWDFDYDGVTFTLTPEVGTPAYHTYTVAGSYTVALRVTDSCAIPGPLSVMTTTPVIVYGTGGTCQDITINEVDPDQVGTDTAEFVELHNASGSTIDFSLESYVIVFYNGGTLDDGSDDKAYYAANLDGSMTDGGFYLIGKSGMSPLPDLSFTTTMQNGRDAVALYRGAACDKDDFDTTSTGEPETPPALVVGDCILIDAIVYGSSPADTGLLTALGQSFQFDENAGGNATYESIQRVTDSQGCPMITQATDMTTGGPTPKASNTGCTAVIATITSVQPAAMVCLGVQQTFNGFGYGEGAVTLEWDTDYDGLTFDADLTGASVNWTYATIGVYTLGLRVTDSCSPTAGSKIVTTTITIQDCCDPVSANITSVLPGYTVCAGTEVDFIGSGAGEGTLTYEWDFDYDGVTFNSLGSGTAVSHQFNTAKGHTIALQVTDSCNLPSPQTVIHTVPLIVNACSGGCPDVTINELDSEQAGTDTHEFVELHNNTGASIDLAGQGYTLVLFNGSTDGSYASFDLVGTLAADDFYLIGNLAVGPDVVFADSLMQNGADGVALYRGIDCSALAIANGTLAATRIGSCVLVDALVYDTDDEDDTGLLAALGLIEQINENEGLDADNQSIQRLTDSLGCAFGWETPNWSTDNPTTGVSNTSCSMAAITGLTVLPGTTTCQGTVLTLTGTATGEGAITYDWDFDYDGITFTLDATGQTIEHSWAIPDTYTAALRITDSCNNPSPQVLITTVEITVQDCCTLATASIDAIIAGATVCLGQQQSFLGSGTGQGTLTYAWDFHYDGSFNTEATGQNPVYTWPVAGSYVVALQITDSCTVPGPQTALTTAPVIINACLVDKCADITINEIDSDTPGPDVAEFVEFHNNSGLSKNLATDGYVLVYFNGADDASYYAHPLTGVMADGDFHLVGNTSLSPDEITPDGSMENGADAVALYRGATCTASDFPNDSPAAVTVGNCTLVDAILYGALPTDEGLRVALGLTEQIDENANGKRDQQSIQRVTDSAGCPMGWETPNFVVDGPTPGVSNLSCTAATASITSILPGPTVCQGTPQTFSGTGMGEGALTFEWDFDYVAPTFDVMATGPSANYTYPLIGTFTVALRVTDSCGNPSAQQVLDTFVVTIDDCCASISASIASISPAPTVCVGTIQTFTGTGTGEGTLTYEWDFNYNGIDFLVDSTDNPASFTYAAAGSYTVALRVTDSCIVPGAQQVLVSGAVIVNTCPVGYCPDVTINEVDADQADLVNNEFVELHNDTDHLLDLAADNYVLVFYNGYIDASYYAVALTGTIAVDGFYLIGNSSLVPAPDQVFQDNGLQNGQDAVALYRGENCSVSNFPNNTPAAVSVGQCTLVDVLLYGAPPDDAGLMTALGADIQIDENYNGNADGHSIQRTTDSLGCPNSWIGNWKTTTPTPGASN